MKITIEKDDGTKIEYSDIKELMIYGLSASPELFIKTGQPYTEFSFWEGTYGYLIPKSYYHLRQLEREENANIQR